MGKSQLTKPERLTSTTWGTAPRPPKTTMAKEIERKYRLKNNNWKSQVKTSHTIKQGYLNLEPTRTVRVRIIDNKALLTIKGKNIKTTRLEFEYQIPIDDALQLLQLCEKPLLEKTRHEVHLDNLIWEIDEFEGDNQGLTIAEVELQNENQKINLPPWIDQEVSHDPRYYNSNLIKKPYKNWKKIP